MELKWKRKAGRREMIDLSAPVGSLCPLNYSPSRSFTCCIFNICVTECCRTKNRQNVNAALQIICMSFRRKFGCH